MSEGQQHSIAIDGFPKDWSTVGGVRAVKNVTTELKAFILDTTHFENGSNKIKEVL